MNLPVFDGVQQLTGTRELQPDEEGCTYVCKSDKQKKRRLQLKTVCTRDAQECKKWFKKHGHDTYYDLDDAVDAGQ